MKNAVDRWLLAVVALVALAAVIATAVGRGDGPATGADRASGTGDGQAAFADDPRFAQRPLLYPPPPPSDAVAGTQVGPPPTEEAERARLVEAMEALGRPVGPALAWWDRLDGRFDSPTIRAAAATLAGSFAEPALEAMAGGDDIWGQAIVRVGTSQSTRAHATAYYCVTGGRRIISFHRSQLDAPLAYTATTLVHEMLHLTVVADESGGRVEHTAVYWAQLLLLAEFISDDASLGRPEHPNAVVILDRLRSLLATAGTGGLSATAASGQLVDGSPSFELLEVIRDEGEEAGQEKPEPWATVLQAATPGLGDELAARPTTELLLSLEGWGPLSADRWVSVFDALGAEPAAHRVRAGMVPGRPRSSADVAWLAGKVPDDAAEMAFVLEVTNFDQVAKEVEVGFQTATALDFDVATLRELTPEGLRPTWPYPADLELLQAEGAEDRELYSLGRVEPGTTRTFAVDVRPSATVTEGLAWAQVTVDGARAYPSVWRRPEAAPEAPEAPPSALGTVVVAWPPAATEGDGDGSPRALADIGPGRSLTARVTVTGAGYSRPLTIRLGGSSGLVLGEAQGLDGVAPVPGLVDVYRTDRPLAAGEVVTFDVPVTLADGYDPGAVDLTVGATLLDPDDLAVGRTSGSALAEEGCTA